MKRHIVGIDGLRGIAVLAVVAFHAFPDVVTGGYIGVDVFFVVSGFIITKLYYDRLRMGQTTLVEFYARRVRRLAPAYILVVVAVTLLSLLLVAPPLLEEYSSGLGAQAFYLQNFVFWSQGDYFHSAMTKPLLHTWSLAVEEQFYLAYGVVILIARRYPRIAFGLIVCVALASLGLGYQLAVVSPKTNFFLLPARLWEFGIGVLLARAPIPRSSGRFGVLRTGGLVLILIAVFAFDKTDLFPGYQSLLACLGSALVLISVVSETDRSFILGNRLIVYLGKISYSLYLWHWPLISLAAIYFGGSLTAPVAIICVALSILLAGTTYRFLEHPIHRGQLVSSRRVLLGTVAVFCAMFVGAAVFLHDTHGATFRYSPRLAELYIAQQVKSPYRCSYIKRLIEYPSEICPISPSDKDAHGRALVLGDSHADQLDEMIAGAGEQRGFGVYLTTRNCTLDNYGSKRYCSWSVLDKVIADIRKNKIDYVFAIAYMKSDMDEERFLRSTKRLLDSGVKHIFLMYTAPHGDFFDPGERIKDIEQGLPVPTGYDLKDYIRDTRVQRNDVDRANALSNRITVLDPGPLICNGGSCPFEKDGKPLYFDSHHLSPTGADVLRPLYVSAFDKLLAQKTIRAKSFSSASIN